MDGGDFQRRAVEHGYLFEDIGRNALRKLNFNLHGPVVIDELGIEIDEHISNQNGISFFCEFKGSWEGKRPGMKRTDTAKKGLLSGYMLIHEGGYPPFIIITNNLPEAGSASDKMVRAATRHKALFGIFSIEKEDDLRHLSWLSTIDDDPDGYDAPNFRTSSVDKWF